MPRKYQDGGLVAPPAPRATWVGGVAPRGTLVSLPPAAPSQTPAVTTGPVTVPDFGSKVDGALLTHYGYPGDKYWDSSSGKGMGDRDNILQPLKSVALTIPQRQKLFPNAATKNFPNTSTGQSFQLGGNTYIDDDTAPEEGYRVDVYHPSYPGLDKGVSAQTAAQRAAVMPPGYAPSIYNRPQPTGPAVAMMGGYSGQAPQHFQHGGPVVKPTALGAALQTAGQYAGARDVWTQANAPESGLDPEKGFIARGTTAAPAVPVPAPSGPPAAMAPGLGTIGGAPVQPLQQPSQPVATVTREITPGQAPTPAKSEATTEQPPDWAKTEPPTSSQTQAQAPAKSEAQPEQPPAWAKTEPAEKPPDWAKTAPPEVEKQPEAEKPTAYDEFEDPESQRRIAEAEKAGKPAQQPAQTQPGLSPDDALKQARGQLTDQENQDADAVAGWDYSTGKKPSAQQEAAYDKRAAIARALVAPVTTAKELPSQTETPAEPPTKRDVTGGNLIRGMSTIFGLNYDGSIDKQDNGIGAFGGVNTRNPAVKGVAVPVDILETTFGPFTKKNADGTYSLLDTPAAKKVIAAIRSAHVELPDDNGNIHKFGILDLQGSLKYHPNHVLDLTYGAAKEMGYSDNHNISYQIVGGDGKPYPIPDIELAKGRGPGGAPGVDPFAGQPWKSIPVHGGGGPEPPQERQSGFSGGGGEEGAPRPSPERKAQMSIPGDFSDVVGGAAIGSMLAGRGGGAAPAKEEEPQSAMVQALINRGFTPAEAQARASSQAKIIPHEPLETGQPPPAPGIKSALPAPSLALPAGPPAAPPAAPGAGVEQAQAGLGDAIKVLQSLGFKQKGQAAAMLKGVSGKDAGELAKNALAAYQQGKGGAVPKPRPGQPPAAPGAPQMPPPRPAVPQVAQAPPQPQPVTAGVRPAGSTQGVANPLTRGSLAPLLAAGASGLAQAQKQHAEALSPDDPRVKKQADNRTKGEHFVPGDQLHEHYLSGLPNGQGGRQRQILGQAEQAIAEKRPMHISYISAPKEAALYPTRESRTVQYEAHSPEARLMGTTEGQLVGHSFIPVAVGVTMPKKAGEPYQGVIHGLSANAMANNFRHVNEKLIAMGRKTPYAQPDQKFFGDLEGYLHNLNAGHTGTGQGFQVGTEEHPIEPDLSHTPHKLTRHEADFINTVINNTGAFAKHEDGQALRELARINGTLVTPEGETNRMRHDIEQHAPGWRSKVLEPSIRSFKTGLVHEVHPTEQYMPEAIRPGREYQELVQAFGRTGERGRPDIPISASLHHNLEHNGRINRIERDFSEGRIDEHQAREMLHGLGEDPDEYRYIQGSGGLITPYEENPESITPEEHTQLKDNLRKQWIGGKLDVENYRRKAAEVPLPELASRKPTPASPEEAKAPVPIATPAKPKPAPPPATHEPMPGEEEPEETTPPTPSKPPKKAPVSPAEAPEAPAKVKTPEPPETEPETPLTGTEQYVSPNVKEGTKIGGALKQAKSKEHQKARDFYQKVEDNYRPGGGGKVTPTIGNWEGTAEGSSWTHDEKDNLQDARVKAAVKGLHSAQKGTAVFHHHADGPDQHYDIDFPELDHPAVDKLITKHGFPASTIFQGPEGLRAHLIDPGGENHERATELAAEAKSQSPKFRWGTAAFDGGDDRASAAEAYRGILKEGGVRTRGGEGGVTLRGHPSGGEHPLQPLYEEAEDNFARLHKAVGAQPPEAPGAPPAPVEAKGPPATGPPAALGPVEPPPAPTGPAKKPKVKAQAPKEKLSKPKDWNVASEAERQAYLEQKVAGTLADQYRGKETHELKVQRNKDGGIKYDPQGNPIYEKHDYDIANSPLLKKKALGEIEGADEHEDTIGDLIGPDGKPVIDPETGERVKQHAHLNQVERRRLSAMRAKSAVATLGDKIVESYRKLQGMPEIMAGEGWYSRMRKRLAEHLGEHHEVFAQLLGATSAKTPVRTNFIQALDALEQLKAGKFDKHIKKYQEAYDQLKQGKGALSRYMIEQGIKPIDGSDSHSSDADAMAHWIEHHKILPLQKNGSKYNANSEAVLKVLAGTWLKEVGAPKTPNFAGNLTGRTLEATIDVWAARHLQRLGYEGLTKGKPWRAQVAAEPGVNGLDFAFSQDAMRHAADKLGIKPDDLQAVLWFAEKHHYENKGWTRGQGAEKGSFDETADLAFPKSGAPMTSAEIKGHYNKIRLAHKALEYESHPKEFMRKKLQPYLEKHGIEQHHLEAARAEGAEPEEID